MTVYPKLQVRILPQEMAMEVEVDIDWSTCGCHMVVDSLVSIAEKHWNMKLQGMEVALQGRMLFVLKLSKTVMPGMEGAAVAA
jgi:hypothetical protein